MVARRRGGGLAMIPAMCLLAVACTADPLRAAPPPPQVGIAHDPLADAIYTPPAGPPGAALTQRGADSRIGWDSTETALTVGSVAQRFGKRTAYPVDGKVYAQPLYVPNLTIDGGTHDVVIAATQHDSVYAFDADATGATPPAPLWRVSLLAPDARTFQ